jgi:hypothetical protein
VVQLANGRVATRRTFELELGRDNHPSFGQTKEKEKRERGKENDQK